MSVNVYFIFVDFFNLEPVNV